MSARLRPMLGTLTATLVGAGVAIGSGIFRNPGDVAQAARWPAWMLAAWLFGGLFCILAGLLIAELATRFPHAGGEYVYLRHAYGDFTGFFFGWAYTIFIIGGGVATMAVGFGDFACKFFGVSIPMSGDSGVLSVTPSGLFGAAAVIAVTAVNLFGLRSGAMTQNILTALKVLALLAIVAFAFVFGRPIDWHSAAPAMPRGPVPLGVLGVFSAAMMPVMWCYEGTTDASKIAEEVRNPRRGMPRALIGANLLVTAVYLLLNVAFLRVLSPAEMAGSKLVAADVLARWIGPTAGRVTVALSMIVVLGALSSTIVACVRVPFALGRDRMTFGFLGRMSPGQSPTAALLVCAGLAVGFTFLGIYEQVLAVYTISSGVLFGLVNLSLLVFRLRDRRRVDGEPDHFRCPAGMAVSVFLAGTQFLIAAGTAIRQPQLALYTLYALVAIGLLYLVWPKPQRGAAELAR